MEKRVTVAFTTTEEIKDKLTKAANERGVSVSSLVNIAIFDYFQYLNAKEQIALKRAEAERL